MNESDHKPFDGPESSAETPPETSAAPPASPGEMLREAREASGMSQADLAEAAKLPQATIASLECDDFEVLNEAVYVRGYYRKCALTLEADVDAIVGAYERKAKPAAPALPDKIPVVAGGGVSLLRRLLRGLLLLMLLGLLVGAGWWLLQAPVGDVGSDGFAPFEDETGSETDTGSSAAPAAGDRDEAGTALGGDPSAEAPVDRAATEDDADAAGQPEELEEPEEPQTAAAESADPVLELRFEEESWLRVRDDDGQSLRNELYSAGSSEELEREPPLEVFVGYAPGVELRWRGERVGLESATRSNDTALVTLE